VRHEEALAPHLIEQIRRPVATGIDDEHHGGIRPPAAIVIV